MRKDIIGVLIFSFIGIIVVLLYNPNYEKRCFKLIDQEKELEIDGLIIDKYCMKGDMYPYLEIQSFEDSSILKKSFHSEFSGIFDYVEVGDSVSKPIGSLIYTIKRDAISIEMRFTKSCNKLNED